MCRCDDPTRTDKFLLCEHCRGKLQMISDTLTELGVDDLRVTQVTTTGDPQPGRLLGQPASAVINAQK